MAELLQDSDCKSRRSQQRTNTSCIGQHQLHSWRRGNLRILYHSEFAAVKPLDLEQLSEA
jgi:hypothetical protein